MARQKVSVNSLAMQVGIPVSTLRRSVLGQRPFNIDELHDVAEFLNISMAELIHNSAVVRSA